MFAADDGVPSDFSCPPSLPRGPNDGLTGLPATIAQILCLRKGLPQDVGVYIVEVWSSPNGERTSLDLGQSREPVIASPEANHRLISFPGGPMTRTYKKKGGHGGKREGAGRPRGNLIVPPEDRGIVSADLGWGTSRS